MKRSVCMTASFAAMALGCLISSTASAGIADSPLPVLEAGKKTLFLYSVPAVIAGGYLGTFFVCTSTDTASQQVSVEIFGNLGGGPCNDAAADSRSVLPGAAVSFATSPPINEILGGTIADSYVCGTIGHGSARILSTSKKLECTAFVGDWFNSPTQTSWQLTIIKKLTQKGN